MNKLAIPLTLAAALAAAVLAAAPAMAGPGQCYDAYGRPVGPGYDTDRPNYAFIDSVVRRGGSCTGVVSPPSRRGYRNDGYGYDDGYRYRRDRDDRSQYSPYQRRSLKPDINGNLPPIEMPDRTR